MGEASFSIVRSSHATIIEAARLAKRFPELKIAVDAHVGDWAPSSIAVEYSCRRAEVVGEELVANGANKACIRARGWGMSISAPNRWPHCAATIRAEIFFILHEAEFPTRPSYYECAKDPPPVQGWEG